ncbi:MAG: class I SAM-dependent methyltransferase [Tahibacter sp.]
MRLPDVLRGDMGVIAQLLRGMPQHADHAQRLSTFYAPQAAQYDRFRERLLRGRAEMIAQLPLFSGARVVELGAGTGRNVDFFGTAVERIGSIQLVDLCEPLLVQARERASRQAKIQVICADATTWRPGQAVDCVYLSYSLSMIPDWRRAIRNALSMLKPGGVLGVVDFYISARRALPGCVQHGAVTRSFWPRWFRHDGVRLDPEQLLTLREQLPDHELVECRGAVPYLPLLRVPYFTFVGRKPR